MLRNNSNKKYDGTKNRHMKIRNLTFCEGSQPSCGPANKELTLIIGLISHCTSSLINQIGPGIKRANSPDSGIDQDMNLETDCRLKVKPDCTILYRRGGRAAGEKSMLISQGKKGELLQVSKFNL